MRSAPFFALLNNRRGQRFLDRDDLDRAATMFARATTHLPGWSVPWYNLGLVRKIQHRWAESLAANLTAADLDATDEAAWWNAGIAATALGDWPTARRAWEAFGITLPPGDGEIVMQLGLTPIRIHPASQTAEVVWCHRIDPARARIRNIPLPSSGYRYGDLLLHDGAPNGTRVHDGKEVPVFDALQLLQPSSYTTYAVQIRAGHEADVLALATRAVHHELGIEDWETIRHLCKACSEGVPGAHPEAGAYAPGQALTLAIAARSDGELWRVLTDWASDHPASAVSQVSVLVPGARESRS